MQLWEYKKATGITEKPPTPLNLISRLTKQLQRLRTQWAYPVGPVPVYGPVWRHVADDSRAGPHAGSLAALLQ
ncbi:hypothetical protein JTB14_024182 [Gonioctena quinquepunctata]|nr:hypothetical protein JTB14_024182 [Gonioctena quinquepunctata]